MTDPLYAKDLLRLAAHAHGAGHWDHADAEGMAHNPACGDRISVQLQLDEHGHIRAFAHETKACVLTQASASILGAHLAGADAASLHRLRADVAGMLQNGAPPAHPFEDYAALAGAAPYRNRHACVLLPIDAALKALDAHNESGQSAEHK